MSLKIQEEYKNRPIAKLFDMYYRLPERMLITDGKGRILFVSEIIERESAEQITGQPIAAIIDTDVALTILGAFAKMMPISVSGMWAKKRCTFSMTPYDGCMVISINTSRPQDTVSIIDANSVSFFEHETKNTISVINAALENLKKCGCCENENIQKNIALICQGIMRISHLTGDFIDCAKFDINKFGIDANIGNLAQCVSLACDSAADIFKKLGIGFEADIEDEVAVSVFDKNKIRHMLFNILAVCCDNNQSRSIKLWFRAEGKNAVIKILADKRKTGGMINLINVNKELEAAEYADFGIPSSAAVASAHSGRLVCDETDEQLVFIITLPLNIGEESMRFNSPFEIHTDEAEGYEEFSRVLSWQEYK